MTLKEVEEKGMKVKQGVKINEEIRRYKITKTKTKGTKKSAKEGSKYRGG